MAAPKGNEYYLLRNRDGRFRIFTDPKEISDLLPQYIETCLANPWIRYEVIKSGDRAGELIPVPNVSTMSTEGFALFAGVSAWRVIDSLKEVSEDFLQIVTHVEATIRTYQLEGALAGALNSNIVARIHGYADRRSLSFEDEEESFLERVVLHSDVDADEELKRINEE